VVIMVFMGGDTIHRKLQMFSGEPTGVVRVDKREVSVKWKEYTLMIEAVRSSATWEGPSTAGSSPPPPPVNKNFLWTAARGGSVKNLHFDSETPSVAERLSLGLRGLTDTVDK